MVFLVILLIFNVGCATTISGGLEFGKPQLIKIKREDLVISPSKITAYYVFKNSSALDRFETLIFELPEKIEDSNSHKTNLSKFSIEVNGKPIKYKKEIRAYNKNGIEISTILNKLNLSKEPLIASSQISDRIQFDDNLINELSKYELLNANKNGVSWNTRIFYYWQQKFPALKEVHIKQVYSPSINISPGSLELTANDESKFKALLKKIKRKKTNLNDSNIFKHVKLHTKKYDTNLQHFCFKEQDIEKIYEVEVSSIAKKTISVEKFKSILNTFWDKHAGEQKFLVHELSYGLLKDAHWSGPIEHFTLRLEYPKYMTPVFCWEHDIHYNKNGILSQVTNFLPKNNINVLFLEKLT